MSLKKTFLFAAATFVFLNGCSTPSTPTAAPKAAVDAGTFFDDFNYGDTTDLASGNWMVRNKPGLPGLPGAHWGPDTVSVIDDPTEKGNRVVRMVARTDGTPAGTFQSQICHQRKYFEGTYASRVYLSDDPMTGPDGDVFIQSFYVISPLKHGFDPQFSEIDWEYLANGGWGNSKTRLYSTSWQTVQIEPWSAFNHSKEIVRSMVGWRTLVMQVADGKTRFFLDGIQVDESGGRNYPVIPMSINFNIWYVVNGFVPENKGLRAYSEDIDWVFHARNRVLSPAEVDAAVKAARQAGTKQTDTVPDMKLVNTCDF